MFQKVLIMDCRSGMILNGMILYGHSHYKDDISHMFKPVIQKILIYHYQDVSLADRSNGLIRTISADRKYDILYVYEVQDKMSLTL